MFAGGFSSGSLPSRLAVHLPIAVAMFQERLTFPFALMFAEHPVAHKAVAIVERHRSPAHAMVAEAECGAECRRAQTGIMPFDHHIGRTVLHDHTRGAGRGR